MNRDGFQPGPLATVDCRASADQWTLVFVRELAHPPETVWAALTDPARLAQWAPFAVDRDLNGVGPATLTMMDGDTPAGDTPIEVRHAEPPILLEYTWGTDLLRWHLAATGTGTRLTLRHTVADRDWLPKVAAGWHLCLVVAEHLLDGRPTGPIRGADARNHGWDDLHDGYARKLAISGTGWPDEA